jgi:hypothetical protein
LGSLLDTQGKQGSRFNQLIDLGRKITARSTKSRKQ